MTPRVCIVLLTYRRTEYALMTLRAALANLRYDGPLFWHVADNGSPREHVDACLAEIRSLGWDASVTVAPNDRGYGGSFNLATQYSHALADYVLVVEDDWQLTRPLDLAPLVAAMEAERELPFAMAGRQPIRCIRMGYLGITGRMYGALAIVAGAHYLVFDEASPDRYVFAGHPRIESVAFERTVGEWPEGLTAGETEVAVANRPEARAGVAWPMDLVYGYGDLWAHIGTEKA